MNAGYEKFFDAKPNSTTSGSQCFSNYYKPCGGTSKYALNARAGIKVERSNSENNSEPASKNDDRNIMNEVGYNANEIKRKFWLRECFSVLSKR